MTLLEGRAYTATCPRTERKERGSEGMDVNTGTIVEGTVVKITNYGAFVELPDGKSGLVHISEIADTYVKDVKDYLKEHDKVKVKILGLNEKGKLDLSVKQALSPEERQQAPRAPRCVGCAGHPAFDRQSEGRRRPPPHALRR